MHSPLTSAMDASLESKFSAAFEQQALSQLMGSKQSAAALAHLLTNSGFGQQPQLNKLVKQFPANASTPPPPSSASSAAALSSSQNSSSAFGQALKSLPVQSQQSLLKTAAAQSQNQTTSSSSSSHHQPASSTTSTTVTEVNGEKIISFRKEKDLNDELSTFISDGRFCDLVICCAGRMFRCHRLVMALSSGYIRDALSLFYNNDDGSAPQDGCNHCNTVILLPSEIKENDVQLIIDYIYQGSVEVNTAGLESFIRTARKLAIRGLSNIQVAYNQDDGDADLVVGADEDDKEQSVGSRKNEYSRGQSLFSTANGINSPPPSPPNLTSSSLASLKALAQNQSFVSTLAAAAAAQQQQNGNKPMNGISRPTVKDQSPRSDPVSLLNNQPNTTSPRNAFPNGLSFFNSAASQIVPPSPGSRRKSKKIPSNIASALQSNELNPFAALYSQLLHANAGADAEKQDEDDKKFLNNEALSDSSTVVDMQATSLAEQFKQASERLGIPLAQVAAAQAAAQAAQQSQYPNQACMVEVDADPTIYGGYNDISENIARLAANMSNGAVNSTSSPKNNKKRKSANKQKTPMDGDFAKKLKTAFGSAVSSSPDISMNPASPLMSLGLSNNQLDFSKVKNEPLEMIFANAAQSNQGSNQGPAAGMSPGSGSFPPGYAGQKWKCEYCNKYYGNKQTLKEHMDYFHSNREEQIYICNICKKEYTWRKSLMKHYRDIHQMRNTPVLTEISRQLVAMSKTGSGNGAGSNSNQSQPSPAGSQDNNTSGLNSTTAAAAAAVAAQSLSGQLDAAQFESLVAHLKNQVAEDADMKGEDDQEVDLSLHLEQSMVCGDEGQSDEETEVNQSDVNQAESTGVDLSSPLGPATDDEKTPDSEASGADSAIDPTGGDASPGSARSSSASA